MWEISQSLPRGGTWFYIEKWARNSRRVLRGVVEREKGIGGGKGVPPNKARRTGALVWDSAGDRYLWRGNRKKIGRGDGKKMGGAKRDSVAMGSCRKGGQGGGLCTAERRRMERSIP